jgi:hypothetical protein
MSSEEQKFLHSQRMLKNDASIRRQTKIAKTFGVDKLVKQPHRMAKHHALDCGHANCPLCSNGRKTNGELTVQEKRMFQDKLHFENSADVSEQYEHLYKEQLQKTSEKWEDDLNTAFKR